MNAMFDARYDVTIFPSVYLSTRCLCVCDLYAVLPPLFSCTQLSYVFERKKKSTYLLWTNMTRYYCRKCLAYYIPNVNANFDKLHF